MEIKYDLIEGNLESLKLAKVRMKVEIHELNLFIRHLVTPLVSISRMSTTSDPIATNIQAIISQLQQDKRFGKIAREWSRKLKFEGLAIIEQLGNVVLRLEIEKDNTLAN